MTPKAALKFCEQRLANMQRAVSMVVDVGIPFDSEATSKIYAKEDGGTGPTVLEVAIWHEYGTQFVPMRSFLRAPFIEKRSEIAKAIDAQFALVLDKGMDAEKALGRIGLTARNISVGAFKTQGYGQWPDIAESTKAEKGSSGILIDTGVLRSSITWVVY